MSCATTKETFKTVYVYPQIYIPTTPKIKAESMILYGWDGKVIKDLSNVKTSDIQNVLVPYWYLQLIADTFLDVEVARTEYEQFINHLE
ncbi:MAG: hypothetical protein MJZ03_03320 [archaeon]|nr:hypothetical protein [archaeon]